MKIGQVYRLLGRPVTINIPLGDHEDDLYTEDVKARLNGTQTHICGCHYHDGELYLYVDGVSSENDGRPWPFRPEWLVDGGEV